MMLKDSVLVRKLIATNEFTDLSLIISTYTKFHFIKKRDQNIFDRLVQLEPYMIRYNNEVKAYGQFGEAHTVNSNNNLMSHIRDNKNDELKYGHKLCRFGTIHYYDPNKSGRYPKNLVKGEDEFRPIIEGLKTPSVFLIPHTEQYNKFNFTYCLYGY